MYVIQSRGFIEIKIYFQNYLLHKQIELSVGIVTEIFLVLLENFSVI